MDDADRAQALQEAELDAAVRRRRHEVVLPETGLCAWCEEPIEPGARFCDRDCSDDYQRHSAKQANERIVRGEP